MTQDKAMGYMRDSVSGEWLNFKCRTEDVGLPPDPIPLPDTIEGTKISHRFSGYTLISGMSAVLAPELVQASPIVAKRRAAQTPLLADGYLRVTQAETKVITPLHNRLSEKLAVWLRHHGFSGVRQEADFVDIEFYRGLEFWRGEIKICHGLTVLRAIREAVAQLLDYNCSGCREEADRWLIVLDQVPSAKDIAFIQALRMRFQLPLSIMWETSSGFEIGAVGDLVPSHSAAAAK